MCIDADKYKFVFLNPNRSVPDRIKAPNEIIVIKLQNEEKTLWLMD